MIEIRALRVDDSRDGFRSGDVDLDRPAPVPMILSLGFHSSRVSLTRRTIDCVNGLQ